MICVFICVHMPRGFVGRGWQVFGLWALIRAFFCCVSDFLFLHKKVHKTISSFFPDFYVLFPKAVGRLMQENGTAVWVIFVSFCLVIVFAFYLLAHPEEFASPKSSSFPRRKPKRKKRKRKQHEKNEKEKNNTKFFSSPG